MGSFDQDITRQSSILISLCSLLFDFICSFAPMEKYNYMNWNDWLQRNLSYYLTWILLDVREFSIVLVSPLSSSKNVQFCHCLPEKCTIPYANAEHSIIHFEKLNSDNCLAWYFFFYYGLVFIGNCDHALANKMLLSPREIYTHTHTHSPTKQIAC